MVEEVMAYALPDVVEIQTAPLGKFVSTLPHPMDYELKRYLGNYKYI